MPHRFKDYPPSTNSGHGRARSLGEGSHQGPDVNPHSFTAPHWVPRWSYRCQVRFFSRSIFRSLKTSRAMNRFRQRSTSFFERPSLRRRVM